MSQSPEGRVTRLDLGCSFHKRNGYIGIDILRSPGVDIVADARRMPFANDTFGEIYSRYALEHIPNNLAVIREIWRVCANGAQVTLILPHFSSPCWSDDLTHVYTYSTRSFEHYDQDMHDLTGHPNYLPEVDLKLIRAELRWWPPQVIARKGWVKRAILSVCNLVINALANAHPFLCERIWCSWVGGFYEVEFKFQVRKP